MFITLMTLFSALSISIIGAYFSIIGLSTIFPGSQISVIIMGTVLEIGKIVTVLWLHKNWLKKIRLVKSYLCFSVVVLMGITSLGIFGFLSKSHIEHQAKASKEMVLMDVINNKIEKEKSLIQQYKQYIENSNSRTTSSNVQFNAEIEREEKRLSQVISSLDRSIEIEQGRISQVMSRIIILDKALSEAQNAGSGLFSNKEKLVSKIKRDQSEERDYVSLQVKKYNDNIEEFRSNSNEEIKEIRNNIKSFRDRENIGFSSSRESIDKASIGIDEASDKIISLEEGKIKYSETIRSIEAEIGPLKYVASLIEDWGGPKVDSGTAVRLVIIVIMVVFDPLAILLLLAAQISFGQASKKEITTYNKLYKKILREPVEVIVPVILPEDENDDDFNVVVSPGKGD
jgi:hypothetical protein